MSAEFLSRLISCFWGLSLIWGTGWMATIGSIREEESTESFPSDFWARISRGMKLAFARWVCPRTSCWCWVRSSSKLSVDLLSTPFFEWRRLSSEDGFGRMGIMLKFLIERPGLGNSAVSFCLCCRVLREGWFSGRSWKGEFLMKFFGASVKL